MSFLSIKCFKFAISIVFLHPKVSTTTEKAFSSLQLLHHALFVHNKTVPAVIGVFWCSVCPSLAKKWVPVQINFSKRVCLSLTLPSSTGLKYVVKPVPQPSPMLPIWQRPSQPSFSDLLRALNRTELCRPWHSIMTHQTVAKLSAHTFFWHNRSNNSFKKTIIILNIKIKNYICLNCQFWSI